MNASLFRFSDEQWAKIEPQLPKNQRGPARDDLTGGYEAASCTCSEAVVAGRIVRQYGPYKTIYNRFARWSKRGIWQKLLASVAGAQDTPEQVAIDSSHIKIHRCASGGKGGPKRKRSASRKVVGTARYMRLSMTSAAPGSSS